jgi:glucose/arabinose dehydrogenase
MLSTRRRLGPRPLALASLAALATIALAQRGALAQGGPLASGDWADLTRPLGVGGQPPWIDLDVPQGDRDRLWLLTDTQIRVVSLARSPQGTVTAVTLQPTSALAIDPLAVLLQARSLAFAPDFQQSGHVYIAYEGRNGRSHIERYTRSATNPEVFEPLTRHIVWANIPVTLEHALGAMHFDRDGLLVIAIGENYDHPRSQDLTSVLGKLVRIDVTADAFPADPNRNYAIPPANPYAQQLSAAGEILVTGLRNPWRWSFDRWNSDIWIGDVGNQSWEEINWLPASTSAGANLAWPYREGNAAGLEPLPPALDPATLTTPAFAYPHTSTPGFNFNTTGCSVTGGVVYRGGQIRAWRGRYFWVDWCRGRLHSAIPSIVAGQRTLTGIIDHTPQLALPGGVNFSQLGMNTIAEDADGELWILRQASGVGTLYRLEPAATQPALADVAGPGGVPQDGLAPDGEYTADDIIAFVSWFVANSPLADVAGPGQSRLVDQELTADDILVFITAFVAGN